MTIYPAKQVKGVYSVTVEQGDVRVTCVDKCRERAFQLARNGVVYYLECKENEKR